MYFVIEISTGDSKVAGKAIYSYENEHDAVAAYHKKLGTAMASELYESDLVMVIDYTGKVVKREYYVAPVETVADEETAAE